MFSETRRIDAEVDLWVETSTNGTEWARSVRVPDAQETGRDCKELRAILATYVAVVEAIGPRFVPMSPWFRVVMQDRETGVVLAVVPRRWSVGAGMYETTGGEWMITDTPPAYRAWIIDTVRSRVVAGV
ncbi:hypothetical protein [Streptomyces sp. MJM1172]|uniref:hypothetical protein n=1 Tax=Streptomyces sp. MJM1172 TaxID=1703926 RepID=UPI000AE936F4|nr:hypothetical protein [Streptomyces sp. MJM1172]